MPEPMLQVPPDEALHMLDEDYHDLAGFIQDEGNRNQLEGFAQMLIESGELSFGEEPNLEYIKGVAHGWVAAMRGIRDDADGVGAGS